MAIFTKRHYAAMAESFRKSHPSRADDDHCFATWDDTVKDMAEMLRRDNERFDIVRFIRECRPQD